jgi:prefoldin subunit 5
MDLRNALERYRREHDEILRFLREFEAAVRLTGEKADEKRCQGLAQLRAMESRLAEIREHCREEEENLDSPFQLYLDDSAMEHLQQQHELLEQLMASFRGTLRTLITPPPTEELVGLGHGLLENLRRHIAFEEGLLKQIEDGNRAEEQLFLRYTQPAE